jgi:hypothetical protein
MPGQRHLDARARHREPLAGHQERRRLWSAHVQLSPSYPGDHGTRQEKGSHNEEDHHHRRDGSGGWPAGYRLRHQHQPWQPDSIVVRVNFVKGSQVLASNVTAYEPTIRPGQSATAEVGWSGPGNTMPAGTQCQVTSVSDSY